MGQPENLENIKNEIGESKTDLDRAVFDSQERIKSKLKLLDINVDGISNKSLIILDKLTNNRTELFPEIILRKAVEEIFKDDPLFNENKLDRKASVDREYIEQSAYDTPEEKQAFISESLELHNDAVRDEIMENPNKYYTEEFFPEEARQASEQATESQT